jgi:excisionase family DNA binding protein
MLGVGRTKVYELMRSGTLRSVKFDGLRRIPVAALAEFVAQLETDAA